MSAIGEQAMSLVLDLPPELETELAAEAARLGLPLAQYVLRLLAAARSPSPALRNGDGTPVAGVSITLNAGHIRESSFPVVTGPDGTFKATVRIGDIEFMREELPKWSLELSKDGYESATLNVSPKQKPESPSKTTQITVEGFLKRGVP
jgi:hypothetical protein